jgi:hypothetical protein
MKSKNPLLFLAALAITLNSQKNSCKKKKKGFLFTSKP